jgi:serine/threonine protein kinase
VDSDSAEEFGPYQVYEQLGIGGMATVHRAERASLAGVRTQVALKRLLKHLSTNRQLVDSFVHEARLASKLHHENIAQTFDLGKVGDTYFISMEYVPGPTLEQVMKHCRAAAGAIPLAVTLGILIQICDALDYAHERTDDETGKPLHIIHRDVSPANIILSNVGCVKLIDFGIAKVDNSNVRTANGVIKGKLNYIAPEYITGQLDARADLFAVGIIAHELITGKQLFEGRDDFEGYLQVLEMPIQPPSRWCTQCPYDLDDVVLTALQRKPDLRWRSARALRTALANITGEHGGVATKKQILEWVQWAFEQKVRPADGQLDQVIATLGQPTRIDHQLTAAQRNELQRFDHKIPTMAGVGEAGSPSQRMAAVSSPTMAPAATWQPASVSQVAHTARPSSLGTSPPPIPSASPPPPPRPSQVRPAVSAPPASPRPSQRSLGELAGQRSLGELAGPAAATVPPHLRTPAPFPVLPPLQPTKPAVARGGKLRFLLYLLLILIAAGAGVSVAAYVFEIELPYIGRLELE